MGGEGTRSTLFWIVRLNVGMEEVMAKLPWKEVPAQAQVPGKPMPKERA